MNFSDVKEMYIPVGGVSTEVIQVEDSNGNVLWKKGSVLPDTYQQVEYIASNSNGQYIDTGLSIWTYCDKLKIEIDMQIPNVTQTPYACQGVGNYGGYYGYYLLIPGGASTYTLKFGSGQYDDAFANVTNDYQRHTYIVDCENEEVYVDSTRYTFTKWNTDTNYGNIFLFGVNKFGTKQNSVIAKIYGCKFYNNGVLLRDFVPCYRIADSVNGLYDLVNDVFYTDPGGNNFDQGNNV